MAATQYIPQFIPKEYIPANDIGVISNIVAQKEKDLDSSLSLQNQAVDALYGLETTKGFEQGRNAVIDNMQKQIQEVINKRGGDPGAALNDITAVVSNVRKDPFFGLNRIALEKSKMLDQLQARNPNLHIFNDTRNVQYNPNLTQEDLNFSVLDPEEINKQVLMNYKGLGERQFAGVGTDATGMYNVARYTQGPSERQIQEILNDPESYAAIRQSFPQLANAPKEVADKIIRDQLQIGLRSLQAPDYTQVLGENDDYKLKKLLETESERTNQLNIPLNPGSELGIKNQKPFDSVKELNKVSKDDVRFPIAQAVKQSAFDKLSEDNKAVVNKIGGLDNLSELNEVIPSLPGIGSTLSKFAEDVTKWGDLIAKGLSTSFAGINPSTVPLVPLRFKKAQESWKEVRKIKKPIDDYLHRRGEILQKYGLDKMNKKERNSFLIEAQHTNNLVNQNINKEIEQNYGDVMGEFYSHNYTTGNTRLDTDTKKIAENLKDKVENIPFSNFEIIGTDSKIDFKNQEKLRKKENEDFLYSSSRGHYRIIETHVDPVLGPIYLLETDKKDGGVEQHLATMTNDNYNRSIINAYGTKNLLESDKEGNMQTSDLITNYNKFKRNEMLKAKFKESLFNLPAFDEFKGGTINDYLIFLENNPSISPQDASDATEFLKLSKAPINTKLK